MKIGKIILLRANRQWINRHNNFRLAFVRAIESGRRFDGTKEGCHFEGIVGRPIGGQSYELMEVVVHLSLLMTI